MSNFTSEQIKAAKTAKTPEELMALAKEQGIELTYEQAANAVPPTGELTDEELENAAGGGCNDAISGCPKGLTEKGFSKENCMGCPHLVWDEKGESYTFKTQYNCMLCKNV